MSDGDEEGALDLSGGVQAALAVDRVASSGLSINRVAGELGLHETVPLTLDDAVRGGGAGCCEAGGGGAAGGAVAG